MKPGAAEGWMPFPGHRTMAEVMREELAARRAPSPHHADQTARSADADPRIAPQKPRDAGSADLHDRGSPPVRAAQAEHPQPLPNRGSALTRTSGGAAGASNAETRRLEAGSTPARGRSPIDTVAQAVAWLRSNGLTVILSGAYWLIDGRAVPSSAMVDYARLYRARSERPQGRL